MKTTNRIMQLAALLAVVLVFLWGCKKDDEDTNDNPTIASVTVQPATCNPGAVVSVTVSANDPDGDALSYDYTATGGAISGTGATASWTTPLAAGSYSVTVKVSDGEGGSASASGAVSVQASVTQINGTASFLAGTSGDLFNSKVSIYTSWDNWVNNQPIKFSAVTGTGASVSFNIPNVNPGNYYLDVWKDIDNNGFWSSGDFVGWYGSGGLGSPSLTEFQIAQGETFNCTVRMYIIAKGALIPVGK